MEWITLILGAVGLLLILYKLGTRNHKHFSSKGIKSIPAIPFFGSTATFVFRTRHIVYTHVEAFRNYKEDAIVGIMQFSKPVLLIKDLEVIKRITVKDFEHFINHQEFGVESGDEIFSRNLFTLKGEQWRSMRNTLSPAFTANKLKNMVPLINQCGQQLADYLQEGIDKQETGKPLVLELEDLFSRFTTDIIATTAFGFQLNSLQDKNNDFYLMGKQMTSATLWRVVAFLVALLVSPSVAEFLGLTFLSPKERKFFKNLVHDTIAEREKRGIVRPDMIHLLMQARKGELKGDEETDSKVKKAELTELDIAAQAMIFFFAGFDTAATLLTFTGILLAINEDCQSKLQQEIDEVLGDVQELTYERVQTMKYLDMVISESLRIFPPVHEVDRVCTKIFTIPENGKQPAYTVKEGEVVSIPVYAIHRDPDHYPNPDKFDPERFSEENKQNIKPYSYLPFGSGPRMCIANRLASLQAKIAIIHILSRFNLVVVDKTPLPLRLLPDSAAMKVNGGAWVGVTPRHY